MKIDSDSENCQKWLLSASMATGESQIVEELQSKFGELSGGWSESPRAAVVVPLIAPAQTNVIGFLIAGISSKRPFNDGYKGFFGLISRQIASAISNARAWETERSLKETRETALRETEAVNMRLQDVLSSIHNGFVIYDYEWRFTYLNDRQVEIIGMKREDVLGENLWQLFPDAMGSEAEQQLRQVMMERKSTQFEYYYPTWNRWFDIRVFPVKEGIAAITADITERKQIESALRESELNFRTLADSMPQIFWTARPDGFLDYYNQRWFDYTGMNLEQTIGWGWEPVLHPDDVQMCVDVWSESVRTGNEYSIEYRFNRASDAQYRWFLGRAIPLRDENGQIVKWFGSSTDIHDQKIARKVAEQANRIKDEFLAVLSHELRTPLNPILGWVKILQKDRDKLNPKQIELALETIERNAKLQTQLIDDLLDISKIIRGKLSLNEAPLNLATVIEAALETVRLAAEAKSITIHTAKSSEVGIVNGDAGRLQQVVWNLLSNAVKFTPSGGHIWITLTQVENHAQIQIKDSGKGINKEFLPYLFDHFRQEDSATTRKFGGLGLGLAIVRQIAELHGGTVKADSAGEAQGAIFTVEIPTSSIKNSTETLSEVNQPPSNLNGINILVVDDEVDSLQLIAFILEQEGAKITTATSASAALESITKSIPDLIISDIGMPEMDGYELIQRIRASEKSKSIPAIALTAYANETDEQKAITAGFQKHVSKPIDTNTVIDMVVELVRS